MPETPPAGNGADVPLRQLDPQGEAAFLLDVSVKP